jgi:phosphoglycolate phosphatase-like HAD superfamily hydrolase
VLVLTGVAEAEQADGAMKPDVILRDLTELLPLLGQ